MTPALYCGENGTFAGTGRPGRAPTGRAGDRCLPDGGVAATGKRRRWPSGSRADSTAPGARPSLSRGTPAGRVVSGDGPVWDGLCSSQRGGGARGRRADARGSHGVGTYLVRPRNRSYWPSTHRRSRRDRPGIETRPGAVDDQGGPGSRGQVRGPRRFVVHARRVTLHYRIPPAVPTKPVSRTGRPRFASTVTGVARLGGRPETVVSAPQRPPAGGVAIDAEGRRPVRTSTPGANRSDRSGNASLRRQWFTVPRYRWRQNTAVKWIG